MTWTACPRCEGESGNFCGGNCHNGGLYICEHCGNAEEKNSEECPCCGRIDEEMRIARLKSEAEDGNVESAAELYALESAEHDKVALRAAFLAGAGYVGKPTVNAELLEALKAFVLMFELTGNRLFSLTGKPTTYDKAKAAIAKAEGGAK